jgi:hypothetical protein
MILICENLGILGKTSNNNYIYIEKKRKSLPVILTMKEINL